MRRIHRQRREHGEDEGAKLGGEEFVIALIQLGDRDHGDPLLIEGWRDLAHEQIGAPLEEASRPLVNRTQLLTGGHAVGRGLGEGRVDLLLQAGDADLEELVDVLAQDRQEAHPLEQRQGFVLRHGEHAFVKVELRQLSVQVPRLGRRRGRLDGWGL